MWLYNPLIDPLIITLYRMLLPQAMNHFLALTLHFIIIFFLISDNVLSSIKSHEIGAKWVLNFSLGLKSFLAPQPQGTECRLLAIIILGFWCVLIKKCEYAWLCKKHCWLLFVVRHFVFCIDILKPPGQHCAIRPLLLASIVPVDGDVRVCMTVNKTMFLYTVVSTITHWK